jgi:hypothetical protein
VHKAGDVAREIHTTSHWWKNTGDKTVVLLSADILHDKSDKNKRSPSRDDSRETTLGVTPR